MDHEVGCVSCGGMAVVYPANMDADSALICARCGHEIGTLAELRLRAERGDAALARAGDEVLARL